MSATEARESLAAGGLVMDPPCLAGECTHYVVATSPSAGSPVETGSTVSVLFYQRSYRRAPERTETNVGGLSIRLWLPRETVASGHMLRSRMLMQNRTAGAIRYDSCTAGNPRYGLQRVGEQHIEWRQGVVDCAGPEMLDPGFSSPSSGPVFVARTRTGTPLEPGTYFALVDFGDSSPWIRHEITVLPAG